MFIMKGNSSLCAVPCAGVDDVKHLETIGIPGILRMPELSAKAILTRLVNSGYIAEGNYKLDTFKPTNRFIAAGQRYKQTIEPNDNKIGVDTSVLSIELSDEDMTAMMDKIVTA